MPCADAVEAQPISSKAVLITFADGFMGLSDWCLIETTFARCPRSKRRVCHCPQSGARSRNDVHEILSRSSALGHKRTFWRPGAMSALPPKADIGHHIATILKVNRPST